MNQAELIKKIIERKEYSGLPLKDVEIVFKSFDKKNLSDEEKIKKTRELLRKVFSSFSSQNLFTKKIIDPEYVLRKHKSTKERFDYYSETYEKIFENKNEMVTIFDLGSGVNGFSYCFMPKKTKYVAIEGIKQLVDLNNLYFQNQKIPGKVVHGSLFDLKLIERIIKENNGKKIIFMFKIIDSLEALKRDYSKELISFILEKLQDEDKIVLSYALKSMGKRSRFKASRSWIHEFINKNCDIIDEFEFGGEKYLIFTRKQK